MSEEDILRAVDVAIQDLERSSSVHSPVHRRQGSSGARVFPRSGPTSPNDTRPDANFANAGVPLVRNKKLLAWLSKDGSPQALSDPPCASPTPSVGYRVASPPTGTPSGSPRLTRLKLSQDESAKSDTPPGGPVSPGARHTASPPANNSVNNAHPIEEWVQNTSINSVSGFLDSDGASPIVRLFDHSMNSSLKTPLTSVTDPQRRSGTTARTSQATSWSRAPMAEDNDGGFQSSLPKKPSAKNVTFQPPKPLALSVTSDGLECSVGTKGSTHASTACPKPERDGGSPRPHAVDVDRQENSNSSGGLHRTLPVAALVASESSGAFGWSASCIPPFAVPAVHESPPTTLNKGAFIDKVRRYFS